MNRTIWIWWKSLLIRLVGLVIRLSKNMKLTVTGMIGCPAPRQAFGMSRLLGRGGVMYLTKEHEIRNEGRQAGVDMAHLRIALEQAFQECREEWVREDFEGRPWADPTGDRLFLKLVHRLGQGAP